MKRLIQDLLDLNSGQPLKANDVLSQPEDQIHILRRQLKEQQLLFKKGDANSKSIVCSLCNQPVVIVGTQQQEYFFKHGYESGDCPIKTTGKYTHEEINRMKYNGAKESYLHISLKSAIASALQGKNSLCENVRKEKRISAQGLAKEWRRPDVQAEYQNMKLAFEIQLSTTFLDVIVERESFYQSENIFMLWVFYNFSESGSRFTEKDIYYANNRNAYAINDTTKARSLELGELVLLCHYQEPYLSGRNIEDHWKSKEVTLGSLTFDTTTHRVYYFDYDTAVSKLKAELQDSALSNRLTKYWEHRLNLSDSERYEEDQKYFAQLKSEGLIPKSQINQSSFPEELRQILNALFCAKKGEMFAYRYDKWIQVANQVLEYHHQFAGIFIQALKVYGLMDEVLSSDRRGTFQAKRQRVAKGVKDNDPLFTQNLEYRQLFTTLFPELIEHTQENEP